MVIAVAAACAGAQPATAADFRFLAEWGGFGSAPGQFDTPDGIASDAAGNVYVADRENNRVQKFDSSGRFLAMWGRGGGDGSGGSGPGEFSGPFDVTVDGHGHVYVLDSRNNRVQKLDPNGRFLLMWGRNGGDGSFGTGPSELNYPRGIHADGRAVYVADHSNHRVQKFGLDGRFLAMWGRGGGDGSAGSGPGEFAEPRALATDSAGNLYVAEKLNHRIQKLAPDGRVRALWGKDADAGGEAAIGSGDGEFNLPYDVAVDASDHVYVVDTSNTRVQKFDSSGRFLAKWGSPGTGAGQFHDPYGVAVDCRSNIYVTDEGNDRVQKFGDPSARPPRCPPRLVLRRAGTRFSRRGALGVLARCDLACSATLRATIRVPSGPRIGLGPVSQALEPGRAARVELRPARSRRSPLRRALAQHGRLMATIRARASGFSGRSRPARLRAPIGR